MASVHQPPQISFLLPMSRRILSLFHTYKKIILYANTCLTRFLASRSNIAYWAKNILKNQIVILLCHPDQENSLYSKFELQYNKLIYQITVSPSRFTQRQHVHFLTQLQIGHSTSDNSTHKWHSKNICGWLGEDKFVRIFLTLLMPATSHSLRQGCNQQPPNYLLNWLTLNYFHREVLA